MICLYLYEYWSPYNIIRNHLMSTFQCKFNYINSFSHSWDISQQNFYSYWWPNISVVCCHFCIFHICADSHHLGLSSCENQSTGCRDTSWMKFVTKNRDWCDKRAKVKCNFGNTNFGNTMVSMPWFWDWLENRRS